MYLNLAREIKSNLRIPLAVKIGHHFSAFANMAYKFDQAGVDGLVMFNRFYQPDFDLENLEVLSDLNLSSSYELRLRLRWVGILYGRIKADMAVTGGVHTAQDVLKVMMAGASELLYKRVNMGGANLAADKSLFVTPAMIARNLEALDSISGQYGFRVRADVVIEPCVVDIRRYKHVKFGFCPLAGSNSAFVIDPCGNVRICEHSPEILGNIRRGSFR
jgi:hypothetical protein